tara:strand:- start:56 stop:529 length:474 start_codon:yes stop_codon:yes gene_type:complete
VIEGDKMPSGDWWGDIMKYAISGILGFAGGIFIQLIWPQIVGSIECVSTPGQILDSQGNRVPRGAQGTQSPPRFSDARPGMYEISPRGQSREFNAYITTLPSYERSKVIANYPVRIAKGQVFEIHATHAATAELFRYGWLGAWAKHAAIESKTCRDR